MKLMKYINFEENRKIGQKVSWKKSDVIGYKKKMTSRAYATQAKNHCFFEEINLNFLEWY